MSQAVSKNSLIIMFVASYTDSEVNARIAISRSSKWVELIARIKGKLNFAKIKAIYRRSDKMRILNLDDILPKDNLVVKGLDMDAWEDLQQRRDLRALRINIQRLHAKEMRAHAEEEYRAKFEELSSDYVFPGEELGLRLEPGDDGHNAVVAELVDDHVKELCWGLEPGDLISKVNGDNVLKEPFLDIVETIRSTPRPLTLTAVKRSFLPARALTWDWDLRAAHRKSLEDPLDEFYYPGYRSQRAWDSAVLAAQAGDTFGLKARLDGEVDRTHGFMGVSMMHTVLLDPITVHSRSSKGHTVLHGAVLGGSADAVQLCLERGADVAAKDRNGYTALHLAARRGQVDVIDLLLKHGASVHATDAAGCTPLHAATDAGHVKAVAALMYAGSDVNATECQWGWSALHYAAKAGSAKLVDLFLTYGANLSKLSATGQLPSDVAAKFHKQGVAAKLRDATKEMPGVVLLPPVDVAPKVAPPMGHELSEEDLAEHALLQSKEPDAVTVVDRRCAEVIKGQVWLGDYGTMGKEWTRDRAFNAIVVLVPHTVEEVVAVYKAMQWAIRSGDHAQFQDAVNVLVDAEREVVLKQRAEAAAIRRAEEDAAKEAAAKAARRANRKARRERKAAKKAKKAKKKNGLSVSPLQTPVRRLRDAELEDMSSPSSAESSEVEAEEEKKVEGAVDDAHDLPSRDVLPAPPPEDEDDGKPAVVLITLPCGVEAPPVAVWAAVLPNLHRLCRFVRAHAKRNPRAHPHAADLPRGVRERDTALPLAPSRVLLAHATGSHAGVVAFLGFLVAVFGVEAATAVSFLSSAHPGATLVARDLADSLDALRGGLLDRQAQARDARFHSLRLASVAGSKVDRK